MKNPPPQPARSELKPIAGENISRGAWAALVAAFLGWAFDGFEMGLFPLIGKPALTELLGPEGKGQVDGWFSVILAVFLVGAASGGVVFGWLGDRIGRVRAMSLSIFTYAVFTGFCGFATSPEHIVVLRFIASLGMGGEWSLGVALVNEIWPNRSRALLAGLIGAAANVGFLLVALLSMIMVSLVTQLQEALVSLGLSAETAAHYANHENQAWRLLMVAGALPALLTFFVRLFVPESEKWEHEKTRGATQHWATFDLLGVLVGTAAALCVVYLWSPRVSSQPLRWLGTLPLLAVTLVGFMYPVRRYLLRAEQSRSLHGGSRQQVLGRLLFGAGLAGVALLGTWGVLQWVPTWSIDLAKASETPIRFAKEYAQIFSALGAIVGTLVAAVVCDYFGRRLTYFLICLGSLGAALLLYQGNTEYNFQFLACVFLGGATTAAFYGWLPLYLPELFGTSVRATSQGFCFNFGRIIAAVGTLQLPVLKAAFNNSFPTAGSLLSLIYVVGLFLIWFGPETKGKPLPE